MNSTPKPNQVIFTDNLSALQNMKTGSVQLIYIDPPFNTGRTQRRVRMRTTRSKHGNRTGFKGQRYRSIQIDSPSFEDNFDDFHVFIRPRLEEAHRILAPSGSLYFHIDYREVHYCKIMLDQIFGRKNFINEIIWAYDYGARPKRKWPPKHDNILLYVKEREHYFFNADAVERIPYMAPGLVTKEKAERGKLPTDTWWHTIVSPTGKEKTGYPTQKPLGVLRRILQASSQPGDLVLDFFAGSGTTGAAALEIGRHFILIDNNPAAIRIMRTRFAGQPVEFYNPNGNPLPESPHKRRNEDI